MIKFTSTDLLENQNILKTQKDTAIQNAVSLTGLPENHIRLLYESQMLDKFLSNEKISEDSLGMELTGFTGNIVRNEIETKKDFSISDEIAKVLNSDVLNDKKIEELTRLTDTASKIYNIDSIDMLTGISNILLITDPSSKEYILGINKLHNTEEVRNVRLNESFSFDTEHESELKLKLYESIQTLLTKQNSRWGNNYRLENTYQGIMAYLQNETQQMILSKDIESVDKNFQLDVIKSILNNIDNPLYRDFSSIKHLVSDSQTFVFDLVVVVNKFITDNKEVLEYIAPKVVSEYVQISNHLIQNISSSLYSSRVLPNEFKQNIKEVFDKNGIFENDRMLQTFTDNINLRDLFGSHILGQYKISGRAIQIMLDLIKSTSHEFNLRIRPILNQYITKTLSLTSRVDRARFELEKFYR